MDILPFEGVIKELLGIIKEAVPDKDKQAELSFKVIEIQFAFRQKILEIQTVPWVDALVKIMAAFTMFFRPIGSAFMTAFGAFCAYKQIHLPDGLDYVLTMAFPAWGVSRHMNKNNEQKTKQLQAETALKFGITNWN